MVVNFICRASKAGKDGFSPIELSIIINGVRKYITLDRRIKATSFNPKTQKVRNNPEVNEYLAATKAKVFAQEVEMMKNGLVITMDTFMDVYKNGFKSNAVTLLMMFEEHNKLIQSKVELGKLTSSTLSKYEVTKSYIKSYIQDTYNKEDVLMKDVTPKFIEDFFLYLLKEMSNNTAVQKMKQLKKIVRMAFDEGYISSSPFKMTLRREDKEVNPLSLEEVRRIRAKEISIDRLSKVRDLFIFECYTGLAFTDMVKLTPENFIKDEEGNEWIIKSRQKTKIISTIPLLPIAKDILMKYQDELPTLSNQKYNAYLKELGDICGIEKSLHSHLARHTFATILLNSGVDMLSVSKVLGHANSRITEKVYAKVLPETIYGKFKGIESKIM